MKVSEMNFHWISETFTDSNLERNLVQYTGCAVWRIRPLLAASGTPWKPMWFAPNHRDQIRKFAGEFSGTAESSLLRSSDTFLGTRKERRAVQFQRTCGSLWRRGGMLIERRRWTRPYLGRGDAVGVGGPHSGRKTPSGSGSRRPNQFTAEILDDLLSLRLRLASNGRLSFAFTASAPASRLYWRKYGAMFWIQIPYCIVHWIMYFLYEPGWNAGISR